VVQLTALASGEAASNTTAASPTAHPFRNPNWELTVFFRTMVSNRNLKS
jgi:hypothetical protein